MYVSQLSRPILSLPFPVLICLLHAEYEGPLSCVLWAMTSLDFHTIRQSDLVGKGALATWEPNP